MNISGGIRSPRPSRRRLPPSTLTLGGLLEHLALVEEYARHTGHADLVRESIDGLVVEDAPR